MKCFVGALLIAFLISSCGLQRKMNQTRSSLAGVRFSQAKEDGQLKSMVSMSSSRREQGKIDSNIQAKIKSRLDVLGRGFDTVKKNLSIIDSLLGSKKLFRKNYKTLILPLVDSLIKNSELYNDRLQLYVMLEDGLNVTDFQLFELAAFFGPGKHIIPEDKIETARQSFAPILDSIIKFNNRYDKLPRTASLIVLGFADGTGFADSSGLADSIRVLIGRPDASKEEMNKTLSELRAKEIIRLMTDVLFEKKHLLSDKGSLRIEYIGEGKGEEYPLSYIKDYTVDDPRRRIVLCYWAVIPD